jgi:hypothetical protein
VRAPADVRRVADDLVPAGKVVAVAREAVDEEAAAGRGGGHRLLQQPHGDLDGHDLPIPAWVGGRAPVHTGTRI